MQLTTLQLSWETPHPAFLLKWLAVWGGRDLSAVQQLLSGPAGYGGREWASVALVIPIYVFVPQCYEYEQAMSTLFLALV